MTFGVRKRRAVVAFGILLLLLVIAASTAPIWLPAVGRCFVLNDSGEKNAPHVFEALAVPAAPWLSRGPSFARFLRAAEFVQSGRAKFVIMTCARFYDVSGCEMAQQQLAANGYPKLPIREILMPSSPDVVEADAILREVSRIGAKSVAVLVAPLESRRLDRVYRREAARYGVTVSVMVVPDPGFDPGKWFTSRELRKDAAYEILQWIGFP